MLPSNMMAHYVLDGSTCYQLINDFCAYLSSSFGIKEIKALEIYNVSKK
jgi:hypothetical protein